MAVGPAVTGGLIAYPFERAGEMLRLFRDCTLSLPDEMTLFAGLSDQAIAVMIDAFARCPTPMGQLLLEHFHGAATRVGSGDAAFPYRADGYNFLVLSEWTEPAIADRCTAWARRSYAEMAPFMGSHRYVNYMSDDETGEDPVAAAYGANYLRLQQVKKKYDPDNLFHLNQNIRPAA